jgi:hypothetical protein
VYLREHDEAAVWWSIGLRGPADQYVQFPEDLTDQLSWWEEKHVRPLDVDGDKDIDLRDWAMAHRSEAR